MDSKMGQIEALMTSVRFMLISIVIPIPALRRERDLQATLAKIGCSSFLTGTLPGSNRFFASRPYLTVRSGRRSEWRFFSVYQEYVFKSYNVHLWTWRRPGSISLPIGRNLCFTQAWRVICHEGFRNMWMSIMQGLLANMVVNTSCIMKNSTASWMQ